MSTVQEPLLPIVYPDHTAVIIVDVQNAFTDESVTQKWPPLDGVLARLRVFVDEARKAKALVIFIQVTHPQETNSDVWLRQHRRRSPTHLAPATHEAEFHPGFGPVEGDLLIVKHRYSAFFGTPLEVVLRSRGIQTVIVAGLTTDVCVSSTARDAFQRDFYTITLDDCTAEVSQARHESGLQTLAATFGTVCPSTEVIAAWQSQVGQAVT